MEPTLGRHHPTIRRLRALRRDAALRREQNVLVAEGVHVVLEALACGAAVERVVVSPALERHADGARLIDAVLRAGVPLDRTDDDRLRAVQDARGAQPVLAIVERPSASPASMLGETDPMVVGLVGVQDPGNLGAVLRTATAAGAAGCLCADTADPFHPRAVRAAMGASFRLPVVESPANGWRAWSRDSRLPLIVADPRGSLDHDQAALGRGGLLVIGAEGAGVPEELVAQADARVRIRLHGGVESLSVPAAAAVLLFESARQRDAQEPSPSRR